MPTILTILTVKSISSQNEVNSQKYNEDKSSEKLTASLSPPKPETAPVIAPLTIEDKISMDTSNLRNSETDDTSLIVNLDDTQSDLMDSELEVSNTSTENNPKNIDLKSNRKTNNNESNNSLDSMNESPNENKTSINEELNKDLHKLSEKDSSKSKRFVNIE